MEAINPCFDENIDIIERLGIGIRYIINKILEENYNCLSECAGRLEIIPETRNLKITIVKGNLVLKSLKREIIQEKLNVKYLKLHSEEGSHFTILDELKPEELYLKILDYYKVFFGLDQIAQVKLIVELTGFNEERILGIIKTASAYVSNLSDDPSNAEMKLLSQEVYCENGKLYFFRKVKDKYSVQIENYAEELGKQLFGTLKFCFLPID